MSKKKSALYTVLVSLLLGPIVGAIIFMIALMFDPTVTESAAGTQMSGFENSGSGMPLLLFFIIAVSYFVGGLHALLGGLTLATYGWLRGRPPWWVAALAGLVLSVLTMLLQNSLEWQDVPIFLVVHLSAALVCWYATKRFWTVPV